MRFGLGLRESRASRVAPAQIMRQYARPALAVVFVAMLATPAVIRRFNDRVLGVDASAPGGSDTALASYGFRLVESAKAAGLDFVHEAPTLDAKLAHIMPQVASMGAAVSVADVDGDGHPDLYVTNSKEGSKNRLYRNRGDGTFEEVAERFGVADLNHPDTGVSMGSVFGDYDNDGFEDLFLYRWGRPDLFRNDGGKGFTRVTGAALPAWANLNTAVWLDYDRDGRLDLFFGGYYSERLNLWSLADARIMPESFEYANNGGRKYLYRNLGGGRFEEVSAKVGLASTRWALAAVAADLRGTGYPDIFIANDYGVSELFINEGGRFREVGRASGVGYAPKSGMNASVGDVLNQGRLAIYVSNISEEGILLQGNNLWVPTGGTKDLPTYENMARAMGVDLGGWSFGAQFGDLNNDGFLDLYLVNGYVSAARDESYWYDYSKVAGGHQIVIGDAGNWPAMGNRSLAGYQPKKVWMNDGAGGFIDVAQMIGATDRYDGRSVALADLSGRGVLDVVVANQKGPLLLYRNEIPLDRQWIAFDLQGGCRSGAAADGAPASCSNRSAIGAQVELFWSGRQQVQEVSGGSGFCAQNQRRLHFGLGGRGAIDKAVIRWPSGKTQQLDRPDANRVHRVQEPA
jgi:enediyne biosynthesis protein E4